MENPKELTIRSWKALAQEVTNDEQISTATSKEQIKVEGLVQKCFERFEQIASYRSEDGLPLLHRKEHIRYLEKSIGLLTSSYECLDSSRPWLVYWILNAGSVLNFSFSDDTKAQIVDFLKRCQNPTGGFGGGPGQYSHLATTYAAVNSLMIIGNRVAYEAIDKENLYKFLLAVREPSGAFRMHLDGEVDVRGAYCALSAAKLSGLSQEQINELFKDTPNWIKQCQTYEGGFGGVPGLEAHGGYSFCAVAALLLLNTNGGINQRSLLRWVVNRQMKLEGGFQGRTNKLVDGCYSFWQGALVPLVQALISANEVTDDDVHIERTLFDSEALQEYLLICCQKTNGGLVDKPGKPVDLYHTCYCLSGLSISQHCKFTMEPRVIGHFSNEVIPTHPIYNIPPRAVLQAQTFFGHSDPLPEARATRESTQDTDRQTDNGNFEDDEIKSEATATTVSDIWNGRED